MNAFFDRLHDISGRILLPLVIAFGLGLVIALEATQSEVEHWRAAARRAGDAVEHVRIACGQQPDPAAVAEMHALQETRP